MSKFCKECDNLLSSKYTNEELSFNCDLCYIAYKSTPEDTLRKDRVKEQDVMKYAKILKKAADDPATMKARIDCLDKKCNGTIAKQVRLGENMLLFNICIKCGTQCLAQSDF